MVTNQALACLLIQRRRPPFLVRLLAGEHLVDQKQQSVGSFGGTVDFDPGAGTFNLTAAGRFNIFVSKLDSDGDFVWARAMGGTRRTGRFDSRKSAAVYLLSRPTCVGLVLVGLR